MERTSRALYAVTAVLLLLGLALRIVPAPAGGQNLASASPRRLAPGGGAGPTAVEIPGVAAAMVERNLFSPSRSAPPVRYTPPDLAPAPEEQPPARRGPPPTRLRLFGTVVGPSGTAALIDADPKVRGVEIYQIGDEVGGRRIVAVSESTVVLDGTAGRLVLRLQSAPLPTR
jgi:hypothetical protein